ncbi:MAG: UDP-N-acetylmuramate dehydrogenase [Bacteroidetes bacterium]|nr:UDP-N-acetylmuramate dehydrogenase [Bacteroidota bacterium]
MVILDGMRVKPNGLLDFRSEVPLADFTTIELGGNAKYFVRCETVDEIRSALSFAEGEKLPVQILGGGSNIIFPDEGFDGLVLKVDLKGITFTDEGSYPSVIAAAGEVWDGFVKSCVENDLAGVECLSGIPGLVGATPIQNVGAYGQEVKDTIVSVRAIDRSLLEIVEFSQEECCFGYRNSIFKSQDKNRFVIVEVGYKLVKHGQPSLKYAELRNYVETRRKEAGETDLESIREAVLALRRGKSMVVDERDPNSRSVGSFFVNPVLSIAEYENFLGKLKENKIGESPSFKTAEGVKIPAAWLVENSGFHKGYRLGGVGISSNHALALINQSGTTKELLSLAASIEEAVFKKFGIALEREAVVVQRLDPYRNGSVNTKKDVTKSEFQK